jgi:ADP-ribose pyrophosphatase YjhB (NUDIX family)
MKEKTSPKWLEWAREIQQLCQTGLAFSASEYDTQRYKRLTGIAAEITASHSGISKEEIIENFLAHPGYATPKVDIRAAIIENNNILLVQEKMDNKWAMPGGWADVGEAPATAIIRETKEESGLEVIPNKIIGVYDANRNGRPLEFFHAYKIVFLCETLGGNLKARAETIAVDYFRFEDLPELSTARTNTKHIEDVHKHLNNPALPTLFD